MKDELVLLFRKYAQKSIELEHQLPHVWDQCGIKSKCCLRFPTDKPDGFEVEVHVYDDSITVNGEGSHIDFEDDEDNILKVQKALGLVRDMLSERMRIIEYRANKSPYQWDLQFYDDTEWQTEDKMVLLLYNYFGRKSKRILQNNTLPMREIAPNKSL